MASGAVVALSTAAGLESQELSRGRREGPEAPAPGPGRGGPRRGACSARRPGGGGGWVDGKGNLSWVGPGCGRPGLER